MSVTGVGYDESQTDLTSVLVAAHAQTADMVIPYSDSTGCVNLAKSLIQLGITDAKKIVSKEARKSLRVMSRTVQLGLCAAYQAMADGGEGAAEKVKEASDAIARLVRS